MQLQTGQLNQLEIDQTWSQTCGEEQLRSQSFYWSVNTASKSVFDVPLAWKKKQKTKPQWQKECALPNILPLCLTDGVH